MNPYDTPEDALSYEISVALDMTQGWWVWTVYFNGGRVHVGACHTRRGARNTAKRYAKMHKAGIMQSAKKGEGFTSAVAEDFTYNI